MLTTDLGGGLCSSQNLEDNAGLEFRFERSMFCHLWIPLSGLYAVDQKLSSFWGPLQSPSKYRTRFFLNNGVGFFFRIFHRITKLPSGSSRTVLKATSRSALSYWIVLARYVVLFFAGDNLL